MSSVLAWISKMLGQKLLMGEVASQVVPVSSPGACLRTVILFTVAARVAQ